MKQRTHMRQFTTVAIVAAAIAQGALAQPQYEITDLTELAEKIGVVQSEARAINEAGQVVGFEVLPEYKARAIYWEADGEARFLDSLPDDNTTLAVGIDEDGTALGQSVYVWIEHRGHQIIIHREQKAALWRDGEVINLNDLVKKGGEDVNLLFARDISDDGRVVGFAGLIEGPPFDSNGFLFDDGVVTDLRQLQRPVSVNNRGQIVGYLTVGQDKAYLWDNGELINLHDHQKITGVTSRAWGVNDDVLIVGEVQFHISKPEEPTLWIEREPMRLVPEYNRPQGVAQAINNKGQIVGYFNDLDDVNSPWRGFIFQDDKRTDLLELLPQKDGWEVLFPFAINQKGLIVGGGLRNGQWGRAFVMTPLGGGCAGREKISKPKCRQKRGKNRLTVKLKGGLGGDSFAVELSSGQKKEGALNNKGKGKAKFKKLPPGPGTATAAWGCGAQAKKDYDCQ